MRLKYVFLAVNTLVVLASIGPLYDLQETGMSIKSLVMPFIVFTAVINISVFLIFILLIRFIRDLKNGLLTNLVFTIG